MMSGRASAASRDVRGGSILIISLWLITILGALAMAIGKYLSIEVRLTRYHVVRAQVEALARSGVYLAMQRLHEDVAGGETIDWLRDDWASFAGGDPSDPSLWVIGLLPGGTTGLTSSRTLEIRIVDEERKLPLNQVRDDAGDAWFNALSTLLNASAPAERIADYVDANGAPFGAGGLEADDTADPPYRAKNGAVVAHEELLTIPGMAGHFSTLRAQTSTAEGITKLNINTVTGEVLKAVLLAHGIASAAADSAATKLDACRGGDEARFVGESTILETARTECGIADDEGAAVISNNFGIASHRFTVTSTARMVDPKVEARVEALVQRKADGSERPQILAWRES